MEKKLAAVRCPGCGASCLSDKPFCADCGAKLEPDIDAGIDRAIARRVEAALAARLGDQKAVELETSEAIVERVWSWTKTFAALVAVPTGILLLVLTILGITNYGDFKDRVAQAQEQVQAVSSAATQQADQAMREGRALVNQYESSRTTLAEIQKDLPRLQQIREELSKLEDRVGSLESRPMPPDVRKKVEADLDPFRAYLAGIGFRSANDPVELRLTLDKGEINAYYVTGKSVIVFGDAIIDDPDAARKEFCHHVTLKDSRSGARLLEMPEVWPLEQGLTDYYTCSFSGDPRLGKVMAGLVRAAGGESRSELRNLDNQRSFNELKADEFSIPHDEGEIYGGIFWELRTGLTQQVTDTLLREAWTAMRPDDANKGGRSAVRRAFLRRLLDAAGDDVRRGDVIRQAFERRGVKP